MVGLIMLILGQRIGIINANLLSTNRCPANKAIPVIGATLGGCGSSLVATANNIMETIIKFLFISIYTINNTV